MGRRVSEEGMPLQVSSGELQHGDVEAEPTFASARGWCLPRRAVLQPTRRRRGFFIGRRVRDGCMAGWLSWTGGEREMCLYWKCWRRPRGAGSRPRFYEVTWTEVFDEEMADPETEEVKRETHTVNYRHYLPSREAAETLAASLPTAGSIAIRRFPARFRLRGFSIAVSGGAHAVGNGKTVRKRRRPTRSTRCRQSPSASTAHAMPKPTKQQQ